MAAPTPTAPRMPAAYGVPKDGSGGRQLPWSWAVEQLTTARNYWICTTRQDGSPHAAPVWGIWLDDAVWFGTSPESQKGRNLTRDPRLVIHLESGDDTVILEGEVELSRDADKLKQYADAYERKYSHRPTEAGAYVLHPRVAQTWTEKDFPRNATRWVFEED